MKTNIFYKVVLVLSMVVVGCAEEVEEAPLIESAPEMADAMTQTAWSYTGETGPEAWGEVREAYATCSIGTEQSPVALSLADAVQAELPALMFNYSEAMLSVEDSGLGFTATPDGEHTLTIGDDLYTLLQFHAHTPSEHTLNGESFPAEVHFVHQNEAGELAVVGVMIQPGAENEAFAGYVAQASGGEAMGANDLASMLPADKTYLAYSGSLTTPPCSENVRWNVLAEPITWSQEQIDVLVDAHGVTNRPVQPLEGRTVQVSN